MSGSGQVESEDEEEEEEEEILVMTDDEDEFEDAPEGTGDDGGGMPGILTGGSGGGHDAVVVPGIIPLTGTCNLLQPEALGPDFDARCDLLQRRRLRARLAEDCKLLQERKIAIEPAECRLLQERKLREVRQRGCTLLQDTPLGVTPEEATRMRQDMRVVMEPSTELYTRSVEQEALEAQLRKAQLAFSLASAHKWNMLGVGADVKRDIAAELTALRSHEQTAMTPANLARYNLALVTFGTCLGVPPGAVAF